MGSNGTWRTPSRESAAINTSVSIHVGIGHETVAPLRRPWAKNPAAARSHASRYSAKVIVRSCSSMSMIASGVAAARASTRAHNVGAVTELSMSVIWSRTDLESAQRPTLALRKVAAAMLQRQVVPHDEIADLPAVFVAHCRIVEVGPQLVQEILTLTIGEPDDRIGHQLVDEQQRPMSRRVREHHRMRGRGRLRCSRDAKSLRAVIVAVVVDVSCFEIVDPLFQRAGQPLISELRAGKDRLSATRRHLLCVERQARQQRLVETEILMLEQRSFTGDALGARVRDVL